MKIRSRGTTGVLAEGLIFLTCVLLVTVESRQSGANSKNDQSSSSGNNSTSNEGAKIIMSPRVIEVIHGKVNSVAHDVVGSFSEVPLVTKINNLSVDSVENKAVPSAATRLPENITLNTSSILIEKEHSLPLFVSNASLSPPPSDLNVSDDGRDDSPSLAPPLSLDSHAEEEQIARPPSALDVEKDSLEEIVAAVDHIVPTTQPPEPIIIKPPMESFLPVIDKTNTSAEHPDDIPSFSEWAKKQMAEVEKNKGENLTVGSSTKMRLKNHASPDCGAKVVAANPEARSAPAILSPSRDDYMLSPCNVKIWFVVELCEVIQPQRLEIANFELFSSSPQDMNIYVSDRFPTREWSFVATVEAKDERTVQSFSLPRVDLFTKYVKVELLSHYGSEHYCPISLFKAFGTSELEILDNVDNASIDDEDEASLDDASKSSSIDDEEERTLPTRKINLEEAPDSNKEAKRGGDNLFGSAKEAVVSFMKKAAEVLVTGGEKNITCSCPTRPDYQLPGYMMTCGNENEQFCHRICTALSCEMNTLSSYLKSRFLYSILGSSPLCSIFGFQFHDPADDNSRSNGKHSVEMSYVRAFIPDEILAALCHVVACSPLEFFKNSTQEIPSETVESVVEPDKPSQGDRPVENDSEQMEPNVNDSESLGNMSIAPTKTLPEENSTSSSIDISLPGVGPEAPTTNSQTLEQASDDKNLNATLPSSEPLSEESSELPLPGFNPDSNNASKPQDIPIPPIPTAEPVQQAPAPSSQYESPITENGVFGGESSIESIISDITDEEIRTVNPNGEASLPTKSSTVNNPPVAKESVFVRLANRIKALEVNISLSSQYLEELSRRYKRQVEELQRSLSSVLEERRLAEEREALQAVQIAALTAKVESLTDSVAQLLSEQNSWSPNLYVFKQHGFIIAIELIMLFLVVALCGWLTSQTKSPDDRLRPPITAPQRRHSLDEIDSSSTQKIRRPSEAALVPSSATHQELLKDPNRKASREGRNNKRKRRRKDKTDEVLAVDSGALLGNNSPSGGVTTLNSTGQEKPTPTYHPDLLESLEHHRNASSNDGGQTSSRHLCSSHPPFFRTAQWTRKQRLSYSSMHTQTSSSGETINSLTISSKGSPSPSKKKVGAIKKIVKKFF